MNQTSAIVIIGVMTAIAVYFILSSFGVFEFSRGALRTMDTIQVKKKNNKAKKLESRYLNICTQFAKMFGGVLLTPLAITKHEYYIQRLELRTKYLGRLYTVEELRGMHFFPLVLSLIMIPIGFIKPFFFLIPVVALGYAFTYQSTYKGIIADENKIIEDHFIELYLTLFSKLRQGSRARLQTTLENYANTLDSLDKTKEGEVMAKFTKHFLNLLAMYEDHVAVPKLRELYDTPVIINFCNIAAQSLNGIDNLDSLISFKVQLIQRQTEMMKHRQEVLLAKGNRSIYAIWIILAILIIVGWWSKLPTDMISEVFGS